MNGNEITEDTPIEDIDLQEPDVRTFVSDGDGTRLDAWLALRCSPEFSRSRIQTFINDGNITVDGAQASAKAKLKAGQVITLEIPPPVPADPQPEDIPIEIVYEDSDIVVINKQAGLVVHPAPGHSSGTLVNAVLFHCGRELSGIGGTIRPGIVHRLDKDTTGLIVVAKTEQALNNLAEQFKTGRTSKTYFTLVHGTPPATSGTIKTTIGRHPTDRKRMSANPPRGKPAVSHYKVEKRFSTTTLLRVRIETGRTHQIRVHMAFLGCPVVGDPVYGKPALDKRIPNCPARQLLHAAEFSFDHPASGKRIELKAEMPEDMTSVLRNLEKD